MASGSAPTNHIVLMLVLLTAVRSILEAPAAPQRPMPTPYRGADAVAAEKPSLDLLRWMSADDKILYLHQHYMLHVVHCATS